MQKKYLIFEQLFDICVVCIIVECLQDCYVVLGMVYVYYKYIFNEFDDYIVMLKVNGYQFIYIVIVGLEGKVVEIQICI